MVCRKVNIYSCSNGIKIDKVDLPEIFLYPIRTDILNFVHTNMSKNKRQPYARSKNAGMKSSAKSWGTGRAVARVPRVPGSGTHKSGQGAITNMCRGGRMFNPTTIWRKWHHKINKDQRTQAIISAIACSGIPSLIIARGHDLNRVPEIPLVLESSTEILVKTKKGLNALKYIGLSHKKKKSLRPGKGKMRNRRFLKYKAPLIIYENNARCFRNIPGIEICCVKSLNLLKIAPGGHVGRLCVWTYGSFVKLNLLYRSNKNISKKNSIAFDNIISNSNLKEIINSEQIQSVVRPIAKSIIHFRKKHTRK
nr:60S ribosomal protein L1 [Cryptomonas sp.]